MVVLDSCECSVDATAGIPVGAAWNYVVTTILTWRGSRT